PCTPSGLELASRGRGAGAASASCKAPWPAAVELLALAQRLLAQAPAALGDQPQQHPSRAAARGGRARGVSLRAHPRGEHREVVLGTEQFPELIGAAGDAADVQGFSAPPRLLAPGLSLAPASDQLAARCARREAGRCPACTGTGSVIGVGAVEHFRRITKLL